MWLVPVLALALALALGGASPAVAGCDTTTTTSSSTTTSTTLHAPCDAEWPTCDGVCPGDGVCAPPDYTTASCVCFDPAQPCYSSWPVCNGECDNGNACRVTGTIPFTECTCAAPGTLCSDQPFPTCGGDGCAGGQGCFPVTTLVGGGFPVSACLCGGTAPCGAGGLACPPGKACTQIRGFPPTFICYPP